jgi:hypothetical protein
MLSLVHQPFNRRHPGEKDVYVTLGKRAPIRGGVSKLGTQGKQGTEYNKRYI